jgi:hypothetical protein
LIQSAARIKNPGSTTRYEKTAPKRILKGRDQRLKVWNQ